MSDTNGTDGEVKTVDKKAFFDAVIRIINGEDDAAARIMALTGCDHSTAWTMIRSFQTAMDARETQNKFNIVWPTAEDIARADKVRRERRL